MSEKKMILSKGPLTGVLIQIQFSAIVQIAKYIPDVQDELRKKKYPLYDVLKGEGIQTGPHGDIVKTTFEQWVFSSNDYSRNILIDNGKITYQVLDCHDFDYENFINEFISIIDSFDKIVDISSITRVGLRYIDSIPEKDNLSWLDLLRDNFHGMSFSPEVKWIDNSLLAISMQRGVDLKNLEMKSNFQLKINQNPFGLKYPQDIMKFPLGEQEVFDNKPLVTFVDLDHYILFKAVDKIKIINRLKSIFEDLHTVIEEVFFNSLITEEAKEIWK
ncbi:MAG: TIGR04255 family protein [Spirochaetaceae bacterium]|nr:TIGR04255 family protein [Spirochaetaceae bacterium]